MYMRGRRKITLLTPITVTGKLVFDMRARMWCTLPYPDHPKGCPNYGKNPECPPQAPLIQDFIDLSKRHLFIVSKFDLASHVAKMRKRHPEWSDRQCRNVLYWQGTVRKELRDECEKICELYGTVYTLIPEAMGINMIKTMKNLGIPIKTRPTDTVYKAALIGFPKRTRNLRDLFRRKYVVLDLFDSSDFEENYWKGVEK